MRVYKREGQDYRLSSILSGFQLEMQVHLVNWKWEHITREPGMHRGSPNDAILPGSITNGYPMLYPKILPAFLQHKQDFPFRLHQYFNHVASSQVANINLFLPVLLHPAVNSIFRKLRPDFDRLASEYLDHGYRIEYWDNDHGNSKGNLNDHTHLSGTDADIAIAYYNRHDELCLWLIEHKLTEKEFTTCGAAKSAGRKAIHDCSKSFSEILEDKQVCYYHSANHYKFWNITETNRSFFVNHNQFAHCPFKGGLNQLWRNQLLALSVEQDERQPYKHATFSVVRHPRNLQLDQTITSYKLLINNNPAFSVFTSADVLSSVSEVKDPDLNQWMDWYQDLYSIHGG